MPPEIDEFKTKVHGLITELLGKKSPDSKEGVLVDKTLEELKVSTPEARSREFISKEVSSALWARLGVIGTLFGIANFAALGLVLLHVTRYAEKEVQDTVDASIKDRMTTQIKRVTEESLQAEHDLTVAQVKANEFSKQEDNIQSELSEIKRQNNSLNSSYHVLEPLKWEDIKKKAEFLDGLPENPTKVIDAVTNYITKHESAFADFQKTHTLDDTTIKNLLDTKVTYGEHFYLLPVSVNGSVFVFKDGSTGTFPQYKDDNQCWELRKWTGK